MLYNPKAFFTHAAWLDQGFPHCPIFPTAASRRSLGRVSVPVWLVILSDQLRIVALVGHYPTNKLIRRRLIQKREVRRSPALPRRAYAVLARVSPGYPPLLGRFLRVTHPFATLLAPEGAFAFDLHVLGLPPAFNLSQDQTLQFKLRVPTGLRRQKRTGLPITTGGKATGGDQGRICLETRNDRSAHTNCLDFLLLKERKRPCRGVERARIIRTRRPPSIRRSELSIIRRIRLKNSDFDFLAPAPAGARLTACRNETPPRNADRTPAAFHCRQHFQRPASRRTGARHDSPAETSRPRYARLTAGPVTKRGSPVPLAPPHSRPGAQDGL